MKKVKFIHIMLLLAFSGMAAQAQGITGSWKKTDDVLTKENGKTTNAFKMMSKAMPCLANIIYTFSVNGKITEQSADCAPSLMKQIGGELANSHFKIAGDQLIIETADSSSPVKSLKYQVKFVGPDEMVWTFIYTDNPGLANITKAKQMQTTYKRQ